MLPVAEQTACIEGMIDAAEGQHVSDTAQSTLTGCDRPHQIKGEAQELRRMDHANDG